MDINQKIKDRRLEIGLTMLQVAKKVGVSEATISRWESGDIANMRRDKIVSLANALRVPPSFIMDNTESPMYDSSPFSKSYNHKDLVILDKYNKLNSLGKEKAENYIDDLLENRKYTDKIVEIKKQSDIISGMAALGGNTASTTVSSDDDNEASDLIY